MDYQELDQITLEETGFFTINTIKEKFYENGICTLVDLLRAHDDNTLLKLFTKTSYDCQSGLYDMVNANIKLLKYKYLGEEPIFNFGEGIIHLSNLYEYDNEKIFKNFGFSDGCKRIFENKIRELIAKGILKEPTIKLGDLIKIIKETTDEFKYGTSGFRRTNFNEINNKIDLFYEYFRKHHNYQGQEETDISKIKIEDTGFFSPITVKKRFNKKHIYTLEDLFNCNEEFIQKHLTFEYDQQTGFNDTMTGIIKLLRYKYLKEDPNIELDDTKYTLSYLKDKKYEPLIKLGFIDKDINILILNSTLSTKENPDVRDIISTLVDSMGKVKFPSSYNKNVIRSFKNKIVTLNEYFESKEKENESNDKKGAIALTEFNNSELEQELHGLYQEREKLNSQIALIENKLQSKRNGNRSIK